MSVAGSVLFYLLGIVTILSALGTVVVHSPIRAAMSLLTHIVSLAGLFLLLHAHLLAALQVVVYAGAVVVLFVFVIMMIGPSVPEPPVLRGMMVKTFSIGMLVLLTALLAFSLMAVRQPLVPLAMCAPEQGAECGQFGGVVAFSKALFQNGIVPFELISVLLTVAIIGAIAVARGRSAEETTALRKKREAEEQKRLALEARERAMAAEVSAHGGH